MNVIPNKTQVKNALAFFGIGKQPVAPNPFIQNKPVESIEKSEESNILELPSKDALEHFNKAQELFEKAEKILDLFNELELQGAKFQEKITGFSVDKETFEKAISEKYQTLQASFEIMGKQVNEIIATPKPRKSFTGIEEIERFEKSKGAEGTTLSLSQHRAQISDVLFAGAELEKGKNANQLLANAVIQLEGTGTLPIGALQYLNSKNINIVQ